MYMYICIQLSSPGRLSSPTQPRVLQLKVVSFQYAPIYSTHQYDVFYQESSTDEGKKEIIHERFGYHEYFSSLHSICCNFRGVTNSLTLNHYLDGCSLVSITYMYVVLCLHVHCYNISIHNNYVCVSLSMVVLNSRD